MNTILALLAQMIGLTVAIVVHQYVYALTSVKLGDRIPKAEGRLTLNPFKHIEPVGFILLIISRFGWGKPVNTNPAYYVDKKKGTIVVATSGIIANLVLAVICGIIFNLTNTLSSINIAFTFFRYILNYIVQYSIILAVVNLIPIYPMDGYRILLSVVKQSTYYKLIQYEKIIQMVVILLAFAGILNIILNPIFVVLYNLFIV